MPKHVTSPEVASRPTLRSHQGARERVLQMWWHLRLCVLFGAGVVSCYWLLSGLKPLDVIVTEVTPGPRRPQLAVLDAFKEMRKCTEAITMAHY